MWRISAGDGRIAWFCGDDRAAIGEMVAELFGGAEDVRVEPAGEADAAGEG